MLVGIWAKVLLALGAAVALGAIVLRAMGILRKAGVDAEHARQADAAAETQKRVDQAVAGVGSLGDDAVRDELRKSLGAAPGAGDPVQRRPSAGSGH